MRRQPRLGRRVVQQCWGVEAARRRQHVWLGLWLVQRVGRAWLRAVRQVPRPSKQEGLQQSVGLRQHRRCGRLGEAQQRLRLRRARLLELLWLLVGARHRRLGMQPVRRRGVREHLLSRRRRQLGRQQVRQRCRPGRLRVR